MTALPSVRIRREDVPPGEVLCAYCTAKCCRYFALPLEEPTEFKDFEFIRWFLLHHGATVFTEDDVWYLLQFSECRHLQADNRCGIYETRPQICRDYTTENCEYDDSWVYDRYFETADQIGEYAEAVLPAADKKNLRSRRPPLLPVIG
ncbi:MAG TPA: YkgJ family cysteine cluster protein [Pirellulales bacterium]|jgi:Fe-S-cluster containining protein|nr:YkgJ family cysteine cluster protein [Pirellulales bacterium]